MWDVPRPGLEPMSPALVGGFLTTALPGKAQECYVETRTLALGMLIIIEFMVLLHPLTEIGNICMYV